MGGVPALIASRSHASAKAAHLASVSGSHMARHGRPGRAGRSRGREAILAGAGSDQIDLAMQFGVKWRPLGQASAGLRAPVTRLH